MGSASSQPSLGFRRRRSRHGKVPVVVLLVFLGVSILFYVNDRDRSEGRGLLDEGSLTFGGSTGRSTGMSVVRYSGRRSRDRDRAEFIRNMMRHAWEGYETYAWGMDELNPVSCTGKLGVMGGSNGFSGLGATLVDAMSTLHLMGMQEEFDRAKHWVRERMDFTLGGEQRVSFFETVIRLLGGLLSAYDMSGDKALLDIAEDLGDRLVGVFDGERSGIATNWATLPMTRPRTIISEHVVLAEAFSNLIELGALGIRTGREEFQLKAEAGPRFLHARNGQSYLVGESVARATGRIRGKSTIATSVDSYYEYLLKYWILTGKTDDHWRDRWVNSVDEALRDLVLEVGEYKFVGTRRKNSKLISPEVTHLGCYYPGNVALGVLSGAVTGEKADEYLGFATGMMATCMELYSSTETGLGADSGAMNNATGKLSVNSGQYFQRPEVVESLFYMWRATHDERWREMAWAIAQTIERYCRVDCGYTGIKDVTVSDPDKIEYDDVQQSWFLAETLKYLYLIFEDDSKIDIAQGWVFNTEAHPVRASLPTGRAVDVDWSYLEGSLHPWLSWTVPHVQRATSLFSRD